MDVTVEGMVAVPTQELPADTTLLLIVNVPPPEQPVVVAPAGDTATPTNSAATAATEQAWRIVRTSHDTDFPDAATASVGHSEG